MQLVQLLSFVLIAAATPLLEPREPWNNHGKKCCEEKCYKALEYADSHDQGNMSKNCKSYLRTTVTPCPKTKTTTIQDISTVTVTTTFGRANPTGKAVKVIKVDDTDLFARHNAHCPSTSAPCKVPKYASKACKPAEFFSACSCLGVAPKTITLPRSTVTKTKYDRKTTTATETVYPVTTASSGCTDGIVTITNVQTVDPSTTITVRGTAITITLTNMPAATTTEYRRIKRKLEKRGTTTVPSTTTSTTSSTTTSTTSSTTSSTTTSSSTITSSSQSTTTTNTDECTTITTVTDITVSGKPITTTLHDTITSYVDPTGPCTTTEIAPTPTVTMYTLSIIPRGITAIPPTTTTSQTTTNDVDPSTCFIPTTAVTSIPDPVTVTVTNFAAII